MTVALSGEIQGGTMASWKAASKECVEADR